MTKSDTKDNVVAIKNYDLQLNNIRINKLKKLKNGWRIEYESGLSEIAPTSHTYPSKPDMATGSSTIDFQNTLDKFIGYAVAWSYLADDWEHFGEVIGISFKHEDRGVGLTITVSGTPDSDESPTINVTTPYFSPRRCPEAQKDIQALFFQILLYLKGHRLNQQLSLDVDAS